MLKKLEEIPVELGEFQLLEATSWGVAAAPSAHFIWGAPLASAPEASGGHAALRQGHPCGGGTCGQGSTFGLAQGRLKFSGSFPRRTPGFCCPLWGSAKKWNPPRQIEELPLAVKTMPVFPSAPRWKP